MSGDGYRFNLRTGVAWKKLRRIGSHLTRLRNDASIISVQEPENWSRSRFYTPLPGSSRPKSHIFGQRAIRTGPLGQPGEFKKHRMFAVSLSYFYGSPR